jgi:hypothetical protein
MKTDDVIKELKSLDLIKQPLTQVEDLLNNIKDIGFMLETLHKGKSLIRAR